MKSWNERAMYIVICISLSFHESSCLYDDNDYFDSDLIPFLSISTKLSHVSQKNEKTMTTKTTSQVQYSVKNLQPHNYVTVTAIPTRQYNSTSSNIRNVFQSELKEPLTSSYEMIREIITGDSKCDRGKDSANILQIKNSDFFNKEVNQHFSNYATYGPKLDEKFSILNKTNTNKLAHTDDLFIMKRNNEDLDKYTYSNFFDSLLSLLSKLNPDLLNLLNANIKKFQTYDEIEGDSMSNSSPYLRYETSSTLKTILCNCDYCRTGIPDTVLYIVSGKKSNNSVSYHKLTSINRSKSKTSYRYQLQTPDDNDSNSSLQSRYPPVNYDKPIFENIFNNAINEKVINSDVMTNYSYNQLPMMKMDPLSRNLSEKLTSGYKRLRGRGLYKPSNENNNESPNIPLRKLTEPKTNTYKPSFYLGNRPFAKYTDWKNNEENQYDEKDDSNNGVEPFISINQSTTIHSSEFSKYGHSGWIMSDSNEIESLNCDEGINESTLSSFSRSINNAEVNEKFMGSSNEITETQNNHSSIRSNPKENCVSVEEPYNDAGDTTTEANYNIIQFYPGSLKGMIKNNYLKQMCHTKRIQKRTIAATDTTTSMFLRRVSKTDLDIHPNINEDYKVTKAMNPDGNVQNRSSEPLDMSIKDIFNKSMYDVEGRSVTRKKSIEAKTINGITLSKDRNDISNNNKFKNGSVWKQPEMSASSTAFSKQTSLSHPTVRSSLITTIVPTTTILNNYINKKETYINYDLNLRNLVGECDIDDKIMWS